MKNKWLRKCLILFCTGCLIFSMTGCDKVQEKAQGLADKVLGREDVQEEETQEEETQDREPEIEVAEPELTTNLSGSVTYKPGDTAKALEVEATVSDQGTITYQWYQSTSNKNGGGTMIEGATEKTYIPSTAEEGTIYYYVVATNTIGNSSSGVTSDTAEVIVSKEASQEGQDNAEGQEKAEGQDNAEGQEKTENKEENKEAEGAESGGQENQG